MRDKWLFTSSCQPVQLLALIQFVRPYEHYMNDLGDAFISTIFPLSSNIRNNNNMYKWETNAYLLAGSGEGLFGGTTPKLSVPLRDLVIPTSSKNAEIDTLRFCSLQINSCGWAGTLAEWVLTKAINTGDSPSQRSHQQSGDERTRWSGPHSFVMAQAWNGYTPAQSAPTFASQSGLCQHDRSNHTASAMRLLESQR